MYLKIRIYHVKMLLLVLWGVLTFIYTYADEGREYKFRTMSPSGGLGYDGIKSIIQDKNGFVWIVTADELFHFDGFNYKRYSKRISMLNDVSSSVYYQSVFADSKQQLYLATSKGVFLYDEHSDMFENIYQGAVTRIYEDGFGSLWFMGDELGLYNPETRDYTHFDMMDSESTYMNSILCSTPESKDVYIGTDRGKIFCIKGHDREIDVVYTFPEKTRITAAHFIGKRLWVLTETKGLFVLDVRQKEIIKKYDFLLQEAENKVPAKCFYVDKQNRIWIGTQQGLYLFDPQTETYKLFTRNIKNPFSIVNNSVWTIAGDEQDNLWIGTYSGGISYLALNETTGFDTHTLDQYGFTPRPISAFVRQDDRLWLGTEGGGLYFYDQNKGIVHAYSHRSGSNSLSYDYVKTLLSDKSGNLWIGMYRGGIDCLNTRNGTFKNYNSNSPDRRILSNEISKIVAESDSGMWVVYQVSGTMLTYFPFKGDHSNHYFLGKENIGYENKRIIDVCRSRDGYLWLASYDDIFRFDIKKRKSEMLPVSADNGSYSIRSLFFDDHSGILWIGTQNKGLLQYHVKTGDCTTYDTILKFGSITINSISSDDKGNLWLGCNSGLFRFNKQDHTFLRYDNNDAIQGLVFYPHAVYLDENGKIYFGGTEGFTCIDPEKVHINKFKSRVLIADFQLNNQSVFNDSSFYTVVSQLSKGESVELSYNQNNVSIELSSTNYVLPLKNRYRYRLKGYNDEWIEVDALRRYISYPKLPAGKYVFEAMASNNDGVWGDPFSITFIVKAAPWASWWAYTLYACLFLLALYLYYRNRLKNHKLENEIYLAACRKQDQEENHQARLLFFTNITHDFKTPLTMILGTIDSMEQDELNIPEGYMQALKSNSSRLLKLVNEVIDFRMVEKGMMSVKLTRGNLNALVHSCASELREYAIKKEIVFRIITSASVSDNLLFDYQMVEKIVLNLLDNAVKYTSAGGRVSMETYSDIRKFETEYTESHTEGKVEECRHYFGFVVKDTGIGISADSITKVFDRFYRVNDEDGEEHLGSGIGLALVRSLVLLHEGFITISSERGKGTDILVGLPMKEEEESSMTEQPEVTEEIILPTQVPSETFSDFALDYKVSDKRTLLLVEDNEDLRIMIDRRLSPFFDILMASNGREALGVLEMKDVDLILCDWMMPLMTGIELCREVKKSEKWSHIPFVLMTVRSGAENHLEGSVSGAEAYIEKPLNFKLLLTTLTNLLALRDRFRQHYAENYFIDMGEHTKNKAGNDFMEKLTGILKREIASRDVNVEDIAQEMMMSRRKLFSLVKENTGKSVVEFIRSYKMRYAARLMVEENLAIKEIPQRIGIESASYFTKAFKAEFGDTPSAFLSKMKSRL